MHPNISYDANITIINVLLHTLLVTSCPSYFAWKVKGHRIQKNQTSTTRWKVIVSKTWFKGLPYTAHKMYLIWEGKTDISALLGNILWLNLVQLARKASISNMKKQ